LADNIVGTAFVTIRALTQGVKRDIRRGFEQGAKDARRDVDREGNKLGQRFGDRVGQGFDRSQWARIVSKSVKSASKLASREIDKAHTEALRMQGQFEQRRINLISKSINKEVRERIQQLGRAHTEALKLDTKFERERRRIAELGAQAREKSSRDAAIAEIQDTIRVSKAYQKESKRISSVVTRLSTERRKALTETTKTVRESFEAIEQVGRRAISSASSTGRRIGQRLGRSIGRELAFEIRRLPILPFFLAAFAPALAGVSKIIAAFVGEAVSLLSPLGPAIGASLAVLGQGLTVAAQGFGVLFTAFKTEGPLLDKFNDRLDETRDRLRDLGKDIQAVTLETFNRSIERVADALLPRLSSELTQTGRVLATVSRRFAALSEDPFFQARFGTVLASNNRVLESLGRAAVSLADALVTVLAAASPLTEQFAAYVANVAAGWSETLRLSQETGRLADWFHRTGEFLQQLGRIGSNVRQALSETFRIANRDAFDLWGRIEGLTERWLTFTRSVSGRNQIADFLDRARAVVIEVTGLFGDMFRLVGRGLVSNSDSLIAFIRTLRFQVLPAVGEMGSAFAGLGPMFNELVVSVANLFRTLAQTGAISTFISTLRTAFQVLEAMISMPVVGEITRWTIAFLAFGKALNIVTLGAFTRALTPLLGRLSEVGVALGIVARQAVVAAGGAGLGALRGSAGLLAGALGGGVGLAITGVVVGLGLLVKSHFDAKKAAEEHQAKMLDFASTLDRATGAVTEQSREWIASEAESRGLTDSVAALGLETSLLTDAALGNAQAQDELNAAMEGNLARQTAGFMREFSDSARDAVTGVEGLKFSQEDLTAAMEAGGDELERFLNTALATGQITPQLADEIRNAAVEHNDLRGFVDELNAAMAEEQQRIRDIAAAAGTTSAEVRTLSDAIGVLADEFASADDKARALDDALSVLEGGERDIDEATRRMHQSFRDVDDALVDTAASAEKGKTVYRDLTDAIDASTGKLDQTTEVGAIVADTYDRLFDNASAAALAIAESGGSAEEVRAPYDTMIGQFRDLLETAGATPEQIDGIVSSLQEVPIETVVDLILNPDPFNDPLDSAEARLAEVDGAQAIAELFGDDTDLANKIVANRGNLNDLDAVIATATADMDDSEAQAVYRRVVTILADLDSQNPTPIAGLDPQILEREKRDIDAKLAELNRQRPTPEVRAETRIFQARKREVDRQLENLRNARANPTVGVTDQATSRLQSIKDLLAGIKSKTITVTTRVAGATGQGGLTVSGAKGLIAAPHGRLIAAAGGALARRAPMVAKGGSNIFWAEPETHAESYIPWAPGKRPRAKKILERTAREFGYQLHPMADGGIVAQTQAALNNDAERSRVSIASSSSEGITVENLNVRAFNDRFSLRQIEDELAMHGAV
jgi:methyl-accepting chemotaxis protein